MKKIYFLFPVYNEEKRILRVKKFLNWLIDNFKDIQYETIFLLNDCNDSTENILKKEFQSYSIKILKSEKKHRGAGLNNAFSKYKDGLIAICSIDNAWNFDFYKEAYNKITKEDFDIIYGSKNQKDSVIHNNLFRKIISKLSGVYVRLLFGKIMTDDSQCIKLFKSDLIFLKHLHNYNYFSETEFYILSKKNKSKNGFLPVVVNNDDKNSKVKFLSIFEYIIESLNYKIFYHKK